MLTLVACGDGGDTPTTAGRIPGTPTPTTAATPTAGATPAATATDAPPPPPGATATLPPAATPTSPPAATATTAPGATPTTAPGATPTTAPVHGQCTFGQPGTFSCAIPPGVTSVAITAIGAGGGGGDACCDASGGFTGLSGGPAESVSTNASIPASGATLGVTVGSGGPHGQWAGDPATRGGRGGTSMVSDGAGGVLAQAAGGTGGLYCQGARRTSPDPAPQACAGPPPGEGGLGGACFPGGNDGCNGAGGSVTITW
jgi:hypothetical protein